MSRYRRLEPKDRDDLRHLHAQCFPIEYADSFYTKSTSLESPYYSLVAVDDDDRLIGVIMARIVTEGRLDPEDGGIVLSRDGQAAMAYLMTLAVDPNHRRRHIGHTLVASTVDHFRHESSVSGIYLHVLTSNDPAIAFYRGLGFVQFRHLPEYYLLPSGERPDAYSYVQYFIGHMDDNRDESHSFDACVSSYMQVVKDAVDAAYQWWHT